MMQGEIAAAPYALLGRTGCDYCDFRSVCHFDSRVNGYKFRTLEELSDEEILGKICRAKEQEE